MKIFVKAKAGAKENKVEEKNPKLWTENTNKTELTVSVKEPPKQGRANLAIIKVLAEYFNISPSQIKLVSGFSSKQKVFEI